MLTLNYPLLLIIDAQKGIDKPDYWGGNRNNLSAEENIRTLLKKFRSIHFPVIHVRHSSKNKTSPLYPDQKGFEFKDFTNPENSEIIITKTETNAFIKTDLEQQIRISKAEEIIITGFVTNNSVEATARMCGNLGHKTFVVADATATFDKTGINGEIYPAELVHLLSLANLKDEYADIISTEQIINGLDGKNK